VRLIGRLATPVQDAAVTAPLVIAGGGLAGGLAALALSERRPEVDFLLLEAGATFGGNHTWSWFESDIGPKGACLADRLPARRWQDHEIRFPRRQRTLSGRYNSLTSASLEALLKSRLRPERYRMEATIAEIRSDSVRLASGERIAASAVIDARGPGGFDQPGLAWQKFLGLTCRFDRPHGLQRPVVMDARVDQSFGYRFVYSLPFSSSEMLIEDTYYSTEAAVDAPRLRRHIADYATAAGWGGFEVAGEEIGVLPILLDGTFDSWWPKGEPVARLGLRGGFFHPTTGYSIPEAVANAVLLAEQRDLSGAALYRLFRQRGEGLWRSGGFYRSLNRMLFHAAPARQRYRVLEHFYRLPEAVIARFYAGRTTALDKLRILSGRPPVKLKPAFAAWRRQG
jgi:lycopene beta-cyclase